MPHPLESRGWGLTGVWNCYHYCWSDAGYQSHRSLLGSDWTGLRSHCQHSHSWALARTTESLWTPAGMKHKITVCPHTHTSMNQLPTQKMTHSTEQQYHNIWQMCRHAKHTVLLHEPILTTRRRMNCAVMLTYTRV